MIEKHENGWWFVCIEDEQGWAPSSYLEPLEGSSSGEVEEIDVQGRGLLICYFFQYHTIQPFLELLRTGVLKILFKVFFNMKNHYFRA